MAIKNDPNNSKVVFEGTTRREFLEKIAVGGIAVFSLGPLGCSALRTISEKEVAGKTCGIVLVDYNKCTGCRTCEAVCSAYHQKVQINGQWLVGTGNPNDANIRVNHFNPDVDIPVVCAMCPDNPCIEACPVDPEPVTNRKALYRDEKIGTVKNDPDRCIGCGSCVTACLDKGVGIIALNPATEKPAQICDLCDGDPQCIKHCPYEALSLMTVATDHEFYRMQPEKIADELARRWYTIQKQEVSDAT